MNPIPENDQNSSLWRVFAVAISFVVLPVLLIVLGAWWLGTSDQGSRWLANKATQFVPTLQLDINSGNLTDGFNLRKVVWQEQDLLVEAFDVQLAWSPSCLLASRLCLTELKIDRINIVSSAPSSTGPIELPEFVSPVNITVKFLSLNHLALSVLDDETQTIEMLEGRDVVLRNDLLSFKHLQASMLGSRVELAGEVQFTGDYPLSLAVNTSLAALQKPLSAKLSGSLRKLAYELTEVEGLPLLLRGTVSPLEKEMSMQTRLVAQQPFDFNLDNTNLAVKTLDATFIGNFDAMTIDLDGVISDASLGDVPIKVMASWRDGHIFLTEGELQLGKYPLKVVGEAFWKEGQSPLFQNVEISQAAATLSLQGDLSKGGLDWSLAIPDLSDYLPSTGHAKLHGNLALLGGGYTATVNVSAKELAVKDVAGATLALQCQLQIDAVQEPVNLTCVEGLVTLPKIQWLPTSDWQILSVPTNLFQWHQGQLSVSPICLEEQTNPELRLCLTEDFYISTNDYSELQLDLAKLPLKWFDGYVPVKAGLSGDADVRIQVASSQAALQVVDWQVRVADYGALEGNVELVDDGALTVRGANIDLAPLRNLYPELGELSGRLNVDVRASLKADRPWLTGTASIQDGRLGVIGQTGLFASSLLQLDMQGQQAELKGQVAAEGGPAELSGTIDWRTPDWQAQVRLLADSLDIEPLPGVTLQLVPDLLLSASPKRTHLSGEIFIPSGQIDLSHVSGSPEVVIVSQDTQIVGEELSEETSTPFSAAIKVSLGDAVRFKGYGLVGRLFGSGELEKPAIGDLLARGTVGVVDGRWRAYGQDLLVDDGRLEFNGPLDEPYLKLRAQRQQTSTGDTVGVLVDGPLDDPRIQLFSSETMSDQERMHYLITGRHMDGSGVSTDGAAAQAAVAMGLSSANQQLGKTAEQFGIQGFALGTEMGERGQEAQISGYFGSNLYLKYSYSMFEPGTAFSARYRLTERFFIEGYQGTNSAMNLLWYIRRR